MSAVVWTEALSLLCAGAGTLCLVSWSLMKTRRMMLLVQLGLALGFATHYGLEGQRTAALLNGLGALHVASSLLWGTSPRLKWIGYGMVPAILAACLLSWGGLPSILSTAGMLLIALGRVQVDPAAVRLLVLAGSPFWLAHDVLVGSPLAFADLLGIGVGLAALLRERRAGLPPQVKREATSSARPAAAFSFRRSGRKEQISSNLAANARSSARALP